MAMDGLPPIEDLSLLPLTRQYPVSDNVYSEYPFDLAFKPKENNSISKKKNEHVADTKLTYGKFQGKRFSWVMDRAPTYRGQKHRYPRVVQNYS